MHNNEYLIKIIRRPDIVIKTHTFERSTFVHKTALGNQVFSYSRWVARVDGQVMRLQKSKGQKFICINFQSFYMIINQHVCNFAPESSIKKEACKSAIVLYLARY